MVIYNKFKISQKIYRVLINILDLFEQNFKFKYKFIKIQKSIRNLKIKSY